jgi:chaperonin GroES
MKLKPVHNHVIIKQVEEEETQYGNIIVPDIGKELPKIGIVTAIGIGTFTQNGDIIPIQVKVGDKVAFASFSGVKFTIQSEDFICLKDQEILTIIEEDEQNN